MVKELRKLKSSFGMALTTEVEYRIEERRQKNLSTLQAYLEDPKFLDGGLRSDRVLPYASKSAITTVAKDIYNRLFNENEPEAPRMNSPQGDSEDVEELTPPPPKKSRSQELHAFREARKSNVSPESLTTSKLLAAIKKALMLYEATGERPPMLNQVLDSIINKRIILKMILYFCFKFMQYKIFFRNIF